MLPAAMLQILATAALPPGPGPFSQTIMTQPVHGARHFGEAAKLCDVSKPPYSAANGSNATGVLSRAILDCGDRTTGGVVLVPEGLTLLTGSLFMRSNLTLRVAGALIGTATGSGDNDPTINDAPIVWARRNALMVDAHAGLINGGRCVRKAPAQTATHPDGCELWTKLENVVIEGGGLLDANASDWYLKWAMRPGHGPLDYNKRPMMLDMMWVDGLTIRDVAIRRPGYWTVHPTFSNNVVVSNNSIITTGSNTDGCDPDSSWNVYIGQNRFSTGDDCIAIKAGRDWSGRMVNISTRNVLAEGNVFEKGHGVSIGSETSGWVTDVIVRDSVLAGTNLAVRLKTSRGRGGGIERVLYENLSGHTNGGIQLNTHYGTSAPTNVSATPVIRNIIVRDVVLHAGSFMNCAGLSDSPIYGILLDNVSITSGKGDDADPSCSDCNVSAIHQPAGASAEPCVTPPPAPPPGECHLVKVLGCFNDTLRGSILPSFQPQTHDKTTHEVCAEACFRSRSYRDDGDNVAGIDGGNHCFCGHRRDLATTAAVASKVALPECSTMPCRGAIAREKANCGGENRLVAYTFHCNNSNSVSKSRRRSRSGGSGGNSPTH